MYAIAAAIYLSSLVFRRDRWLLYGAVVTAIALVPHTISILIRWFALSHGPYLSPYEIMSSNAWVAILAFLVVQLKLPKIKLVGAVIIPLSVLILGIGFYLSSDIKYLAPTLRGYWLFIHIFFAKLTFGSFFIGMGLAILFLLKSSTWTSKNDLFKKTPSSDRLDELSYQFSALGFLFLAVMIIAGSIWANQAWGRYWGWDVTETWSLVTWLVYAVYLHVRITYDWRGKKSAWSLLFAMIFVVFILLVLPNIPVKSIHGAYFQAK